MFSMNKKNRNRFLALVCLLIFLGLGGLFYVNWVVQRPFGVILILAILGIVAAAHKIKKENAATGK